MSISALLRRSVNFVPWSWRNRIRSIPVLAKLQRWLLARFVGHESFRHEINAGPAKGLRVMISLPADKGFWTGTYESNFVGAVAAAVKPDSICFDIGGFHGFVSGVMALAGAREVVCFEPLPANLAAIRQLTELNPKLPITICNLAVGAEDGQSLFVVTTEESMGKIASSTFQRTESGCSSIPVTIRSLDSLIATGEVTPPSLLKIDVEGAEWDVLQGARNLLARDHPELFVEAHSPELRALCEETLRGFGYTTLDLVGSGASVVATAGISHFHASVTRT